MSIDDLMDYDLLDRLAGRVRRPPCCLRRAAYGPGVCREIPRVGRPGSARPVPGGWSPSEEVRGDASQDRERALKTPGPGGSAAGRRLPDRSRGRPRGCMGVVYEAEQVSLGRRVALKVLPWPAGRDHTPQERFRREARASARLHHTNIVLVFEIGHEGEVQYYAMQFIQGQSLDAVIDERCAAAAGRIPPGPSRRPPTPPGHRATRPDESGTLGLAGEMGVARSALTGRSRSGPGGVAGRQRRGPARLGRTGPGRGGGPLGRPGLVGRDAGRRPAFVGRISAPGLPPRRGSHRPASGLSPSVRAYPRHRPPRRQAVEPLAGH